MTPPIAELIVTSPDGRTTHYPLTDAAVIGRHPECQIVLGDPMSSRRHCRVERTPVGGFFVIDNGSANGTLLNSQPLKDKAPIFNGDTIQIGSTLLVLRVEVKPGQSQSGRVEQRSDCTIINLVDEQEDDNAPSVNCSKKVEANLVSEEERNTRDVNQLQQITKRLELLIAVGQAMGASLDPHKLLDKSLEKLFEVFPQADRGIVVLYGPDGAEPSQLTSEKEGTGTLDRRKGAITKVRLRNVGGAGDTEVKLSRTVMKKVRAERKAFVFDDSATGGAGMSIAKFEIKSLMCAPLITEKDDIGFIQVESKNLMNPFRLPDLEILSAVAGQIAVVIRNAELALSAAAAAAQRENLSRFLSPQLVEEVLNEKQSIELGGVEKKGTIFFSDIVGFTKIASKMKPQHVVAVLNRYFTVMQNIIFKRGGSIDKCAGDNIMAHWGMLGNLPYCAESGVTAAVEMQIALFTFNRSEMLREREAEFTPVILGHGIGLNTGMVCAGNIGSERKIEFTVIGDAVNLSARIEAMAGREQTFIGEPTWLEVKSRAFAFRMPDCPAKNVAHLLPVFSIRGIVPPPDKGIAENPADWTVADMLLCLPCRLIAPGGEKINAVVVSIVPTGTDGQAKIELHAERFVKQGVALELEWDLLEKPTFPGFHAEVEASYPIGNSAPFNPTASTIARGRTAIILGRLEPGMVVLKTMSLPPEVAAIRPGVLIPSDLKSHDEIVRA